jgi:hypothetical protein
MLNTPTLKVG